MFWKLLFNARYDPNSMYSISIAFVKIIKNIIINIIDKMWMFNKQGAIINENISFQGLKITLRFVFLDLLFKKLFVKRLKS